MDNKKEYYTKCCEIIDRLLERYLKTLNDDLTDGIKEEDIIPLNDYQINCIDLSKRDNNVK